MHLKLSADRLVVFELCVKECKRACFWYGAVAEDTVQDCSGWLGMSTGSKTGCVGKRSVLNQSCFNSFNKQNPTLSLRKSWHLPKPYQSQ